MMPVLASAISWAAEVLFCWPKPRCGARKLRRIHPIAQQIPFQLFFQNGLHATSKHASLPRLEDDQDLLDIDVCAACDCASEKTSLDRHFWTTIPVLESVQYWLAKGLDMNSYDPPKMWL
jgi:hypothetical protein